MSSLIILTLKATLVKQKKVITIKVDFPERKQNEK